MTKGTRMWITGILKISFWLLALGVTGDNAINKFNEGSWGWGLLYTFAALGAISGAVEALKLIDKSHGEE